VREGSGEGQGVAGLERGPGQGEVRRWQVQVGLGGEGEHGWGQGWWREGGYGLWVQEE
jgi:hypothetical protein